MNSVEAINKLKELQDGVDIEVEHSDADDILCTLLTDLGYADVVKEYQEVNKWYA